jgi:hypothetical protein
MKQTVFLFISLFLIRIMADSQTPKTDFKLPGKGLKQHDFIYVGEWETRKPKV